MTNATADRVLDAVAGWRWVPPGASEARTPEYHLVAYPAELVVPTQVTWCRSSRPASVVVDETVAIARAWGRADLSYWVGDRTTPGDLGEHLRSRGAVHVETVELLSLPLDGEALAAVGLEPEPPTGDDGSFHCGGVEVRQVRDLGTLRDADLVANEVWGSGPRSAEDAGRHLEELSRPEPAEVRVVAYVDGEPACAAGCTLAPDGSGRSTVRLWGGATRQALRGRGAYRATVGTRLWLARQRGADLGIVKAVTTTSAPIVRRLGFTGHGTEDRLRLDLGAAP